MDLRDPHIDIRKEISEIEENSHQSLRFIESAKRKIEAEKEVIVRNDRRLKVLYKKMSDSLREEANVFCEEI